VFPYVNREIQISILTSKSESEFAWVCKTQKGRVRVYGCGWVRRWEGGCVGVHDCESGCLCVYVTVRVYLRDGALAISPMSDWSAGFPPPSSFSSPGTLQHTATHEYNVTDCKPQHTVIQTHCRTMCAPHPPAFP